ncbi:contactin-associated protein-like 5 [Ochotona princeps]|uniref:contactin-associated protein-like 5 n=1 Tax=Ochotona princeps TaxID=9978 RepID=UPI0027148F08|nr:contactin-associated protein-like 5 [Ochotona princeps]
MRMDDDLIQSPGRDKLVVKDVCFFEKMTDLHRVGKWVRKKGDAYITSTQHRHSEWLIDIHRDIDKALKGDQWSRLHPMRMNMASSLNPSESFRKVNPDLVSDSHHCAWCHGAQLSSFSLSTFLGNMNADSVVHHKLPHSVRARFIRFVPLWWNPSGKIGMRVEVYGCSYKSDIANFDGRSSLLYRFSQKLMSTLKDVISLKFKSLHRDWVLFHGEGQRGDHISLELQKGRLALHLNLDDSTARICTSPPSATLGGLLDDQHWHSVLIEQVGKQVNFTVDRHTQHFRSKGAADSLDIDYQLSFGGIPVPGKPGTFLKKNFHGCIENLYYDGVNIIDLAKRRKHQIHTGNITFSCSEPPIVPITFVNSCNSYLLLPGTPQIDGLSVSFQSRTWNEDGVLLSTELSEGSGTLLLSLEGSILRLLIQKTTQHVAEILTGSNLHDGLWHVVSLSARRNRVTLTVDNYAESTAQDTTPVQIYSGGSYYLRGCPDRLTEPQCLSPVKAFQGCMRLIFFDNQPKDLISVQQGALGNLSGLHTDLCSIEDRCLPNYCEHGGSCSQSWSTFHCNCSGTGYSGATCHNSIYEQSCEVYMHQGNTAGFFHIDSDGSGPLAPLQMYCNITEDEIRTTVQHNNAELTHVQGYSHEKSYTMTLDYGGSMEQLEALIDSSEHCRRSHCRRSHLVNMADGAPYIWWIGRSKEKFPFWGGSPPTSQQCECGLDKGFLDIPHFCNCDMDKDEWTNYTGLLSFKEQLPDTQIVITHTNRSNLDAAWRIGPLRCYGDRHLWNAVTFDTEGSFLHFPAFHVEFSADISFCFKTTAFSGVFLENLGMKDFIRLEMSSPSKLMYYYIITTFMSNTIIVSYIIIPIPETPIITTTILTVTTKLQHHHHLCHPATTLMITTSTTIILISAISTMTAIWLASVICNLLQKCKRQKGFQGCIRSLHMNGQNLDLEERARGTSGVRPSCPGHCSSYGSICHNGGRCVEKHSGYLCDCTSSPYEGAFCSKEVSAVFEAGTSSVTYTFQEPYAVTKNFNLSSSAIYADAAPSKENIALTFTTGQAPSLLLFINYSSQDFLAALLYKNGSLQVRYQLSKEDTHVFTIDTENFANGKMHHLKINREGRELTMQVDQLSCNFSLETKLRSARSLTLGKVTESLVLDSEVIKANSLGFLGCLSSVQYNHVAPLKAALRHATTAPVTIQGTLAEASCGSMVDSTANAVTTEHSSSDPFEKADEREPLTSAVRSVSAIFRGVIALVIFVTACSISVTICFLYQHQQSLRTSQMKNEYPEDLASAFRNEIDLQDTANERKHEHFI